MIIDTHSHIFDETFSNDIDDVILRAKQAGVAAVLLPNIDTESIKEVNSLAERHKGYCLPTVSYTHLTLPTNSLV